MKNFFLIITLIYGYTGLYAQPASCDGSRYSQTTFDSVKVTTVKFGRNSNNLGVPIDLFMDIHEPKEDANTDVRPLMILAHGGSFIAGQRTDLSALCDTIARLGYVCATVDYRLGFFFAIPDSIDMLDVAFKAIGDFKAANRFFLQDADTDNRFRIDTGFIVYGGVSAGAIAAVHAAYLDETDSIPDYLAAVIEANGGLNGDTGDSTNQSYTAKAHAVWNASGAIHKAEWIDQGEPPIYSYHGTDDETVPYGDGHVSFFGSPILSLKGSQIIHDRADSMDIHNRLLTVPLGGHTDIYEPEGQFFDSLEVMTEEFPSFMADLYCNPITATQDIEIISHLTFYPNPTSGIVFIKSEEQSSRNWIIQVFDIQGRAITQIKTIDNFIDLKSHDLRSGMYLIRVIDRIEKQILQSELIILN